MGVQKTNKGYWQVSYRDENGVGRTRSFGKGKAAKKKAQAFDAEISYKKKTQQSLPLTRSQGVYFDELAQQWIQEKRAQGRKKQWLSDLAHILNNYFLQPLCKKPAHLITQDDILAVVTAKYADSSQATRNRYVGYIKSIFEFGVETGYLDKNPLRRWKKAKEAARNSQLTLKDLRTIQAVASRKGSRCHHLAWAIEVAWNVPVRPGKDLYGLTYSRNVNFDRHGIEVYHSKVGRWTFIVCNQDFIQELNLRQKKSSKGFVIEYQGKPVNRLDTALKNMAHKAGLNYKPCMYDIRHLWITTAVNHGLEPSVIADCAGTSIEMIHKNYYEEHSAERARISETMPSLSSGPKQNVVKLVVND